MSRHEEFAIGARLYFECAEAADREIGRLPGFEIHAPFPVMSNVAHAIELALKAYLLRHGETGIRRYGHDLVLLAEACAKNGESAGDGRTIQIDWDLLKDLSDVHKGMTLRYGEKYKPSSLPVYGPLSELTRSVFSFAGVPTLEDIYGDVT